MYMEDFLGHSHNLRKPLKFFPKLIASKNFKTVEKEITFLNTLKKKDFKQYLLFPDLKLLPLKSYEKKIFKFSFTANSE